MFDTTVLNDIQVTNKKAARVLPAPGNYEVQLVGVGPALTQSGSLRKEFGRPLFEIAELTILGPFPVSGDFKLWQRLPMTDVKEYDRNVNYVRELVRAYDDTAEFANAAEAFGLITEFVEDGRPINVRLQYFAEDFKGAQQAKIDEGLNVGFSQLDEVQLRRRNEIDRTSKVKGVKPFDLGDGNFANQWVSPFGNTCPVRLNISRFFNSSYNPFDAS